MTATSKAALRQRRYRQQPYKHWINILLNDFPYDCLHRLAAHHDESLAGIISQLLIRAEQEVKQELGSRLYDRGELKKYQDGY